MLDYLTSMFMLGGTLAFYMLLLLPVLFLLGVSVVYFLAEVLWKFGEG